MPSREVTLRDIESLPSQRVRGVDVKLAAPGQPFRRWRPALVRGDRPFPFLHHYFITPAPMSWAGTVSLGPATVIVDGLMLLGNELLIGNGLMYPKQCFPYAHSPIEAEEGGNGVWRINCPDNVIELEGTTANAICDGWQIYGHWLVDVLPRIERIKRSGIAIDTFLFAGPEQEWQRRLIEAVGIDLDRCLFVDVLSTAVNCEKLVFSTYDRFNSEIRPELLDLHDRLINECCGSEKVVERRRLFVSRGKWSGSRPLANRGEVEAQAEAAGFEICLPENYSFADQIRLFASAEIIVGECGSGLHNAMFSPTQAKIGVIQSNDNLNFLQAQIAMMRDQEIYFCIGAPTGGQNGEFSVDPMDVRYMMNAMKE